MVGASTLAHAVRAGGGEWGTKNGSECPSPPPTPHLPVPPQMFSPVLVRHDENRKVP